MLALNIVCTLEHYNLNYVRKYLLITLTKNNFKN
jgi:hypothetical protein